MSGVILGKDGKPERRALIVPNHVQQERDALKAAGAAWGRERQREHARARWDRLIHLTQRDLIRAHLAVVARTHDERVRFLHA